MTVNRGIFSEDLIFVLHVNHYTRVVSLKDHIENQGLLMIINDLDMNKGDLRRNIISDRKIQFLFRIAVKYSYRNRKLR